MSAAGAGRGAALYLLLLLLSIHNLPLDEACLTTLRSCMEDPAGNLHNWTKPTFAAPCNGSTSDLQGVACNNGRVHKLSLAGAISPFLSNCTNLQSLDLSSNHLHGRIQPELATLLNLAALNLSSNRLSGAILPELGLLARLCTFDVSDNCLSGSVPAMLRFHARSFQGNEGVYGHPLPPVKNKGMPISAMVGIGLASLVFSLAVVCVCLRETDSGCGVSEEDGEEGKMSSSCRSVERRHNHLLLVDHELEEHWLLHG